MATEITNGYTDLPTYKLRFFDGDTGDIKDDDNLNRVITATSRAIDHICRRRFYAVTETRYYTPDEVGRLDIYDLLSVSTLKTDEDGDRTYEITWAVTDYDLMPYNAVLDGEPYMWIELAPEGDYSFPLIRKGAELKGSFGYSSTTPAAIEEACLQGAKLLMTPSSPTGVSGGASISKTKAEREIRKDSKIMEMLGYYIRLV